MLAIVFSNGEILVGDYFDGYVDDSHSAWNITNADRLRYGTFKYVKQRGNPWYYSVSNIVKFRDVTEQEAKALKTEYNRDIKLESLL